MRKLLLSARHTHLHSTTWVWHSAKLEMYVAGPSPPPQAKNMGWADDLMTCCSLHARLNHAVAFSWIPPKLWGS